MLSLRKQPTFHEVATWALAKRRLSNERRNSILMTFTTQILVVLLIGWNFLSTNQKHYQDLGRDTSSVWNFCVRTQSSFCEGSSGGLVKRRLFSQASRSMLGELKILWSVYLHIPSSPNPVRVFLLMLQNHREINFHNSVILCKYN